MSEFHGVWEPDDAVVETVLAGRVSHVDLSGRDVQWVVASLTNSGYSVLEIAGWLRCSTRQVKRVRAEFVTQVMVALAANRSGPGDHQRRVVSLQREVRRLREENARLQVDRDVRVSGVLSQDRGSVRRRRGA